ncbi:MAG TPA: DUF4870 domain-containing protein [Clostridia bacterium]|nr:DUF4870 domain-containing protein [Clostridia bacterium]
MANTVHQPHKSSIGNLDANILAAGCYGAAFIFSFIPGARYFAWLAPLIIYFLEKNSVLVKFHATQALILNAIGAILSLVVGVAGTIIAKIVTPKFSTFDYANPNYYNDYSKYLKGLDRAVTVGLIFGIIVWVIVIAIGVLQIIAAIKAYNYTEYGLPIIGGLATKVSEKLDTVNLGATDAQTPPAQQWTPPPAQPTFDPKTGQPITPPAAPAPPPPSERPAFDTQTGKPIDPPTPAQPQFDTETGLPINSDPPENLGD